MRTVLVAITGILGAAAFAADEVIEFHWAGAGGDVATAGGGTWDRDESAVWADSAPDGPLVRWTDHRAAIFSGSSGGTVKLTANLTAAALKFSPTAGPFVFAATGNIEFAGDGISNESPREQAINFERTTLTFREAASAGAGVRGDLVSIRSDGLIEFTGTARAGRATLVNRGEMNFSGQSSAAESSITSVGILFFQDDASSGAAAITNQGILKIEGRAHDFATTAFVNMTGGVLDFSATTPEEVAFGALTNAADGALIVGIKRLTVAHLNLADGNDLQFDCAAGGCGAIRVTTSLFGNAKAGGTRIGVSNLGGLTAGQNLVLLDWSGASSVLGVQVKDFKLQPLADGFRGTLSITDSRLLLSVRASR